MMCELLLLLEGVKNDEEHAHLLSVSTKESGAWLRALPVSALGLWMDDNTVRVAVGLCLGTAVCGPHSYQLCRTDVDALGRHALSCRQSEGRHQRHVEVNDIIQRSLTSAHVPSRLEPTGLSRLDRKSFRVSGNLLFHTEDCNIMLSKVMAFIRTLAVESSRRRERVLSCPLLSAKPFKMPFPSR